MMTPAAELPERENELSVELSNACLSTVEEERSVGGKIRRPVRPLKILFLSSDTGGGHRASAEAIAVQFQRFLPGTTYDLLDVWSESNTYWPYNTLTHTYAVASATPWKWRALYYVTNKPFNAKFYNAHSCLLNEDLIRNKMETYNPDVVISVHPTMNYLPLRSIRTISQKLERYIPFFTVVTDFGSGHLTWFNKEVDKMYLASEPIKQIAQNRCGVPDEKIEKIGLPIRYDFAVQSDAMGDRTSKQGRAHQAKIRDQLKINTTKSMILIMGGGEGVGSLSNILNELYASLYIRGIDATICVVCGRNEKLKADIETRCWETVVTKSVQPYAIQLAFNRAACRVPPDVDDVDHPGKIDVMPLGFVKNMAEFMVAADVLVSKAGPGSIAEAAAVGLPVMVTSHLPGQEAGNVDIVLNAKFGKYCDNPKTIGRELTSWLRDPRLLDEMSRNARKVGHPHAAEEIALDIWKTRDRLMDLY